MCVARMPSHREIQTETVEQAKTWAARVLRSWRSVAGNVAAPGTRRIVTGGAGQAAWSIATPGIRRYATGELEHLDYVSGRKRLHHGAGSRVDFRRRLAHFHPSYSFD